MNRKFCFPLLSVNADSYWGTVLRGQQSVFITAAASTWPGRLSVVIITCWPEECNNRFGSLTEQPVEQRCSLEHYQHSIRKSHIFNSVRTVDQLVSWRLALTSSKVTCQENWAGGQWGTNASESRLKAHSILDLTNHSLKSLKGQLGSVWVTSNFPHFYFSFQLGTLKI